MHSHPQCTAMRTQPPCSRRCAQELNLSNNGIEDKGTEALASCLRAGAMPSLETLYVNEWLVGSRPPGGGNRVPEHSQKEGLALQIACHDRGIDLDKY